MHRTFNFIKISLIAIILFLCNLSGKAQFPSPKHGNIKLVLDTNSATVVYDTVEIFGK
jgi:hypothetical protein